VLGAVLLFAFVTPNRGEEHLAALHPRAGGSSRRLPRLPGHDGALGRDMSLHADVRVFTRRNGYRRLAKRARWSDAVVLARVEVLTLVRLRVEVFTAESMGAVLALEREEVDEEAGGCRALLADTEQPSVPVVLLGRHSRVSVRWEERCERNRPPQEVEIG